MAQIGKHVKTVTNVEPLTVAPLYAPTFAPAKVAEPVPVRRKEEAVR